MDNNTIKTLAIDSFNKAWTYLDKESLRDEEKGDLLNLVHTSLELWKKVDGATPDNYSIGYWQISRAYAHIGDYKNAVLFGQLCLEVEGQSSFCIGYAHEAIGRGLILGGQGVEGKKHLDEIEKILVHLVDDEKDYLEKDYNELLDRINN